MKFEVDAFNWVPSGDDGVEEKLLAVLTERRVTAAMVRATRRTQFTVAADQRQLFFTFKGAFGVLGKTCGPQTSIYSDRGESLELTLEPGWESLLITLPQLPN